MNTLNKRIGIAAALVVGMLFAGVACATPVTMGFDGLTPGIGMSVDNYYNGGCTTFFGILDINCGGPDYGVVWEGAVVRNASGAPSPANYMGLSLFSDQATMNVAAGFSTGLSFYYTDLLTFAGRVTVYSGLDGTGTALASKSLPATGFGWDFVDLTFHGIARSVIFDGFSLVIGFDNVTLDAGAPVNAVPEPAALGMFGFGALLIGLFAGLRRRGYQS